MREDGEPPSISLRIQPNNQGMLKASLKFMNSKSMPAMEGKNSISGN
jgi:hypothetical protein